MLPRLHQITDSSLAREIYKSCLCERWEEEKINPENKKQKARYRPPGDGNCVMAETF